MLEIVETIEEVWKEIPEFPNYQVSNLGRIYSDLRDAILSPSYTTFGHMKINLRSEWERQTYTRSVAQFVAEAFVLRPNLLCDHVVILDGDFSNVAAYNLVWRPRWYMWKYTRQLKVQQPLHFHNLPVVNVCTGVKYSNIIEAGISEGLLFSDIWRSTYTGVSLFPDGAIFEVLK